MMLPNPNISISLNDLELQVANELAYRRFDSCSNDNVINRKVASRKTNQEIEEMGTRSEIAFCKLMNCYPDLSYHSRKGSADCIIDGITIDIKTTKIEKGKLLVTPKKKINGGIDMFVLMTGLDRKFTYRGWMDSASVYQRELSDLGYGPTYVIKQRELKQYEYRR